MYLYVDFLRNFCLCRFDFILLNKRNSEKQISGETGETLMLLWWCMKNDFQDGNFGCCWVVGVSLTFEKLVRHST